MTNLTRAITRALTSPLTRTITSPGVGGGGFSPASLFASGEQGIWLDPSDFSTMFQDSAGTIPVTAAGQSVGRILDKSGRGNHATQANMANKPILQQAGGLYYLAFDGVDDFLSTASVNFTSTDKMTVVAGVRKLSDAAVGTVFETSDSAQGDFWIRAPGAVGSSTYSLFAKGSTQAIATTSPSYVAPNTAVLCAYADIAGDVTAIRVNGALAAESNSDLGSGDWATGPLYIGRRFAAQAHFNGNIYQLIVRGAATPLDGIQAAEAFTAEKTGVTL